MSIRIQTYIRNIILAVMVLGSMFVVMPAADAATADIDQSLCRGANLNVKEEGNCNLNEEETQTKVNDTIAFVINIFSIIVGVVAVIMLIVGGLKYITSNGDSNNVTSAKNTILYAIIGLVVVALAQFVVKFVLSKASGTAER